MLHEMVGTYDAQPRQLSPILLSAGPVDAAGGHAVLVGATMPSGATVAWLSVSSGDSGPVVGRLSTTPAPWGTPVLDRVLAVWAPPLGSPAPGSGPPGRLVLSGPRDGTVAEAVSADRVTVTAARITEGAGVVTMPAGTTSIRVRDADGRLIAEGPVARLVQ